ncbi:MAG: flagellin [Pseudomonadota bacterium]
MSDITLSSAVRQNLLSLQSTADLLSSTQNKLATGREVNSALDNPTNFFTASSLNSRGSDLTRLLDGISNAVQTIEAADNGIEAITSLVESAQASARQALQTPGRTTVTELAGSTSATFDPTSNARVVGSRDTGGLPDLTADAGASDNVTIADDRLNAAVTLSGAFAGATDTSTDTLTTAGLADGETFTIEIDDGTSTLKTVAVTVNGTGTFTQGGSGDNRTLTINTNQTLDTFTAELNNAIDAATGSASIVGEAGTGTNFTLVAESNSVESIRVSSGSTATLTSLGIQAQGTQVGADVNDRIITRNATLDALVGAGDTLSVGSVNPADGNFTATGTANFVTNATGVKTKAGLEAALNNGNIVNAADAGAGAGININLADATDARTSIRFVQGAGDAALAALVGTDDGAGLTDRSTTGPVNLITQGAVDSSESLTFTFGNDTAQTINFGYGAGEVSSLSELNQALSALTGGNASVRTAAGSDGAIRGDITVESDSPDDVVRINSTTGTAATFGLNVGEFSNLVGGTGAPLSSGDTITFQIGASPPNTIRFGTGINDVNTFNELQGALTNISGATASIDDETGAITISSDDPNQSITFSESGGTVGDAFGLTAGVTPPVTTDSSTRANLETDFNELLTQIDQLARDASFNGNNLLQNDDLTVIFNEDGSSSLDIDGVDFDTGGLGVNRITASNTFQQDENIETTLGQLDGAISALRDQAGKFGSNLSVVETRDEFTKNLVNTLETGAANLTLADLNEEGANLLALQTRQQLSTTALSLSAQADQNVLRLF